MNLKFKYSKEELEQALERKRIHLNQPEGADNRKLERIYHQMQTGKYIGDFVYGANDGIITTFAVVTGAIGASLSPIVIIILGFANLLADGFSMGASSFLSKRANLDYQRGQRKKEEWEIEKLPEIEVEEIRDSFKNMGFKNKDLDKATEIIVSDPKRWVDFMMINELGIFEEEDDKSLKHAVATFSAFIIAGLMPLLPFLIPQVSKNAIVFSFLFTAIALFTAGSLRTLITPKKWWIGGVEMLLVGTLAASVAYFVGFIIKSIIGVSF